MPEIQIKVGSRSFSAIDQGQGPLVLLLHGFPDTAQTWAAQIDAISQAGYRCVAPTMRGYEPSSQEGPYFVADLADDIIGWMESLGADQAHLIGHDWGAITAYAAAAMHPERFLSLTTLAIPHLSVLKQGMKEISKQRWNSAYIGFFQLRGIAEWRLKRKNYQYIEKLWRRWSPGWEFEPEQLEAVQQQFKKEGVAEAALSYYRALYSKGRERSQAASVHAIDVATLALGGRRDQCMDYRLFGLMDDSKKFTASLKVEIIDSAGHFLHREQAGAVNDLIIDWLGQHSVS